MAKKIPGIGETFSKMPVWKNKYYCTRLWRLGPIQNIKFWDASQASYFWLKIVFDPIVFHKFTVLGVKFIFWIKSNETVSRMTTFLLDTHIFYFLKEDNPIFLWWPKGNFFHFWKNFITPLQRKTSHKWKTVLGSTAPSIFFKILDFVGGGSLPSFAGI